MGRAEEGEGRAQRGPGPRDAGRARSVRPGKYVGRGRRRRFGGGAAAGSDGGAEGKVVVCGGGTGVWGSGITIREGHEHKNGARGGCRPGRVGLGRVGLGRVLRVGLGLGLWEEGEAAGAQLAVLEAPGEKGRHTHTQTHAHTHTHTHTHTTSFIAISITLQGRHKKGEARTRHLPNPGSRVRSVTAGPGESELFGGRPAQAGVRGAASWAGGGGGRAWEPPPPPPGS